MMRWQRKRQAVRQRPPHDWGALLAHALRVMLPYRRAAVLGVAGVVFSGVLWSGWQALATQPELWPVERVVICRMQSGQCQPLLHADPAALQKAAQALVQDGMVLLFPQAIRQALQRVAWIKHVAVSRQWPASVRIDIEEYQAAARWWPDGEFCHAAMPYCDLLDTSGQVFSVAQADWDAALPCLSGPPDSAAQVFAHYQQLRPLLQGYAQNIRCLRMSARRDWDLTLADGTLLRLGKQALAARLQRFFKVYPLLLQDSGDLQIAHFDLRYPNGVVVQWR